ncbi:MAG: 2-hydroxyacyl-CoA dehydratase family protein [Synergistaceae bacterium]|nr:2-hydroxyacyl-CoA dehydratase family protein [Synergistaceae bacterium]
MNLNLNLKMNLEDKEIGIPTERTLKILKKASERAKAEVEKNLKSLAEREDYSPQFDYFMKLCGGEQTPEAIERRTGRSAARLLCIQAPIELIHAAGFHPYKIASGSQAMTSLAAHGLPALMCPMIRAVIGAVLESGPGSGTSPVTSPWILPTTCDWVAKFPEMLRSFGVENRIHWMELPHLKDGDAGQARWLEEVFGLKKFLETSGAKIGRKSLADSVRIYDDAWRALNRLAKMRREERIANVWFMLIAGSFFLDSPERWTEAALSIAPSSAPPSGPGRARVFLAGSPIFFPNFKLLHLLEDTGITVAADDLCSGERVFPGAVACKDTSEFGIISALAQRYHQGCLCPTFIDNDRRVNGILCEKRTAGLRGVVFHVLKGCHPYDLESLGIERILKERGLRFLRIETDYASEDSQNLRTRLEAYRRTFGGERDEL